MKATLKPTISVLYIIGMLLFLMATGLLGLLPASSLQGWYLLAQLLAFGLGIGHLYLLYRFLPQLDANRLVPGLLATLLLALVAMGSIMLLHQFVFRTDELAFGTCVIPFAIPYLFAWVYRMYCHIPRREYKIWYYPLGKPMPDLDLIDLSKILLIQFELPKKITDTTATNFKAKAPVQMTLGELFLIFLNDYNEQNSASGIQVTDEQNVPIGWHFYYKKRWPASRNYFDPDLTFQQNNIRDNLIIRAQRA